MTREEAIEVIEQDIPCERDTDLIEALEMAIKALEQEPITDRIEYGTDGNAYRLTISNGKEFKQEPILDKIRNEITNTGAYEQETMGKTAFLNGINYCLGVIDKYRGEA